MIILTVTNFERYLLLVGEASGVFTGGRFPQSPLFLDEAAVLMLYTKSMLHSFKQTKVRTDVVS